MRNLKSKRSERAQPILPMEIGQLERRTHNYVRNGTLDLFAALNIATGEVLARCKPQHWAQDPWRSCVRSGRASSPRWRCMRCRITSPRIERRSCIAGYSATRAYICISFRPTRRGSISWNASLACSPEKALRRGSHTSVPQLRAAILAYVEAHNDKGKPFTWTKTADEILDKIRRFGRRTQQVHAQ